MDEKKFVTLEMFEEYHKRLMEYIGMHDDLILNGETTCPKCGAKLIKRKSKKGGNKHEENHSENSEPGSCGRHGPELF